jgi:hypothetical protein
MWEMSQLVKGFESEKSSSSTSLERENPLFWMASHQWIYGQFFWCLKFYFIFPIWVGESFLHDLKRHVGIFVVYIKG